jgi:hypothetical protein
LKSKSVSIAWKIMMIPNFAVLLMGLVFTFIPDAILSNGFRLFSGQNWSDLVSASPKTAEFILLTAGRMFGVHVLAIAILLFAITLAGLRRGERWSWYALLSVDTLLIFDIFAVSIIGEIPVVLMDIVMVSLSYIALGISAKEILGKKST